MEKVKSPTRLQKGTSPEQLKRLGIKQEVKPIPCFKLKFESQRSINMDSISKFYENGKITDYLLANGLIKKEEEK